MRLRAPGPPATHKVTALRTLVFSGPSIKLPPVEALPFGARIAVARIDDRMAILPSGFYVPLAHLKPIGEDETDFVAVAERFLGAPYLWGGKTVLGLDCSGLVQVALTACGIASPRDSDMQEQALGKSVAADAYSDLRRGDLMFWNGHVAIIRDRATAPSRQCVSYGGRYRAHRRCHQTHRRRRQRYHQRAADRVIENDGWCRSRRVHLLSLSDPGADAMSTQDPVVVPHIHDTPAPSHFWRLNFWIKELPFSAVLILTLIGVAYTSFSKKPITGYWELLTPLIALVCVGTGWHSETDRAGRVRLIGTQVLHWWRSSS